MTGLKLREYQEQAVDFLYERNRAMILAPMGAGKTAIALSAMKELLRDGHAALVAASDLLAVRAALGVGAVTA